MASFSGFNGAVTLKGGAIFLHAKEWSLRLLADEFDVTHALPRGDVDAGFMKTLTTLQGAEGGVRAVWNDDDNPFFTAEDVRPSSRVELELWLSRNLAQGFFHFYAYITGAESSNSVRGVPEFSFTFKSDGFISYARSK